MTNTASNYQRRASEKGKLFGCCHNQSHQRILTIFAICVLLALTTAVRTAFAQAVWASQRSGTEFALYDAHFVNSTTGWAVGESGTIVHTNDGGSHWITQASGIIEITTPALNSVFFTDSNTGWAVGSGGVILHTSDGGKEWSNQNSGTNASLYSVFFTDSNTGWAVGSGGVILHTSDGGKEWSNQNSGTNVDLLSMVFVDKSNGWSSGGNGIILYSSDGGDTWTKQYTGTSYALLRVIFIDSNNGWSVGENGTIIHSADGGKRWEKQNSGTAVTLNGVSFPDKENGWAVGTHGTILHTSNDGETWELQESGVVKTLFAVEFTSSHTGWTFGDLGTILELSEQLPSGIIFTVSPLQASFNETIAVTGSVTPPRAGSNVTVLYRLPNGTEIYRSVFTNGQGDFQDYFIPTERGIWTVTTSVEGNARYRSEAAPTWISFSVGQPQAAIGGLSEPISLVLIVPITIFVGAFIVLLAVKGRKGFDEYLRGVS